MPRRIASGTWMVLAIWTTVAAATAAAQWPGFGLWPSAPPGGGDAWSPEAFADFLGSGHPAHPAVVRIVAPENGGTSMGSGVLVDVNATQGLVLTTWHVIRGAKSGVLVQFPDGFQSAGRVIRHDEPWDLAAVAIWRPRAAPVPIAVAPPVIGEPLTINGYGKGPFRSEAGRCTQYLAPGTGYPLEFVELEATARQGDSGGPILNGRGELAGVLFGRAEGRTIGACSTRLRTFLASVGSRGMTADEVAALAVPREPPPLPTAPQSAPMPVPTASLPRPVDPAAEVADASPAPPEPPGDAPAAAASSPGSGSPPAPAAVASAPLEAPPAAWGDAPEGRPEGRSLEELLDPRVNGRPLVVAAAGILLAIVGLRTVFGGRPRSPVRGARQDYGYD